MATPAYPLFCMGNPLLDIQVNANEELLAKYNLKSNDAILADASHMSLYEEIIQHKEVVYVAGGASQNTARGAQRCLPAKSVVYVGATADDYFRAQLISAATADGLTTEYVDIPGDLPTGTCAALISGHDRSLVTKLSAAEKLTVEHIKAEKTWNLVKNAKVYYVEGFFMTFFTQVLDDVLPYMDVVFGNEGEAEAYATAHNLPDPKDVKAIATYIAKLPKVNTQRERLVVFTQGVHNTIVVKSDGTVQEYPIIAIEEKDIVDCNGAGDAFCGGFIAKLVQGADIATAVAKGHYLAHEVIQQVGPTYPREVKQD
ncbi:adenosine kinase [Mortierella antarctica]|nr:adenosine kinase [Mortierella antarctica]